MNPFNEKPPRLKDLVNEHVMGDERQIGAIRGYYRKKMKDQRKLK